MDTCEYCNPGLRSDQSVLLSNEHCLFLQLKNPEIKGSGIIVPKKHKETLFDLSEVEWNATYQLLQEVKKYLDDSFKPDGYNVGWNSGHVGGQHIFHAHMHVIPRFSDEPMAGKGIRYLLKCKENTR
jgi:histidine triad (HIT) family protein